MSDNKSVVFVGSSATAMSSFYDVDVNNAYYSFDIENSWSVMIAVKPSNVGISSSYFHISDILGDTEDQDNTIDIRAVGTEVRLSIAGSAGTHGEPAKVYGYNNAVTVDTWYQFVATWNGTTLKLYKNGSLLTPDTLYIDEALIQTATIDKGLNLARVFGSLEERFAGRKHSAAVWNTVLSADEVATIWNSGNILSIILNENFGTYTKGANCKHWYRLGHDLDFIHRDFGTSSTPAHLYSTNIEVGDLVIDYPGL